MEFSTTDQEEIETLKKWWRENGTSTVAGIVIGLAALFGWQGWSQYQEQQGVGASRYFEQMQSAVIQKQHEKAKQYGGALLEEYPGSVYAAHGALALAALEVEKGDFSAARVRFQWVLENSSHDAPMQLAQLGIARLYLDEGEIESALTRLNAQSETIYPSQFSEVRGDALRMKGDLSGAQLAYTEALQLAERGDQRRALLEMKLTEVTP